MIFRWVCAGVYLALTSAISPPTTKPTPAKVELVSSPTVQTTPANAGGVERKRAPTGPKWSSVRDLWMVRWHRTQNYHKGVVRQRAFNEGTGELLKTAKHDGWDTESDYDLKQGRQRKLTGLNQVMGFDAETTRTASRSAYGFTAVVNEQLATELYCKGARFQKSFFGPVANRRGFLQNDNDCIASCFDFAGLHDANATRSKLASQDWLKTCRAPLTHAFSAKVINVVAKEGPTASVRLPTTALKNVGINHKENLVDVLLLVSITHLPVKLKQEGKQEVRALTLDEIKDANWVVKVAADNRYSKRPGKKHLPPLAWRPFRGRNATRPTDQVLGPYEFKPDSPLMSPKFKAAASLHYAAYETNNFKTTGNTGYYVDDVDVVEMPTPTSVVLDVTPVVKRLWDTDHFEFSLLSNADILAVDSVFVFHGAVQWTYKLQDEKAKSLQDKVACEAAGFKWCKKVDDGSDFLDLAWRDAVGVHKDGRCGVPQDACFLNNLNLMGD